MKKTKLVKVLMLVLSIALVCAGVAISVSAANPTSANVAEVGGVEYDNLDDAFSKAPSGSTVTLISDVELEQTVFVTESITLDMNGYTISSELNVAFSIEDDVKFVINGYGKINVSGKLIDSHDNAPSVTVAGTKGAIIINHDGTVSPNLTSAAAGSYSFNNLDITSAITGTNAAVFHTTAADKGVNFSLVGVECHATGCTAGKASSAECVIRAVGESSVYIKSSTLTFDGTVITLNGNKNKNDVLTIEDSFIRACSGSYEVGAVGIYSDIYGTITVKDSVIESSYRIFALNCENRETIVEVDENGIISATGGARLLVYDSTLHLLGYKAAQIVRACPTFIYGNSRIITTTQPGNLIQYDTVGTSDSANKYVNIYLAEGTRISREYYTTLSTKGFKFPDGSSPGASSTYTFIYDPLGDATAPYVVAKAGAANKVDVSGIDYFYFANGSDSYASDTSGVIYNGGTKISSNYSGDMLGAVSHWWNMVGEYSVVSLNGNSCIKYATIEANKTSTRGPQVIIGKSLKDGLYEPDYSLIIIEADIATDTGAFAAASLKFHARGAADGNADSNGFSNYGDGSSSIAVAPDGTVTANAATDEFAQSVKLSTTSWNRISMVIDATATHPTATKTQGSVTYKYGGTVYYYINSEYVGKSTMAYIEGGYIFGFRADIGSKQDAGRSLLIDNVMMRGYKTVANGFSFDNYDNSVYDMNYPMNKELLVKDYTVGGIAYPDLKSAVDAAAAAGTMASINRDLDNVKVEFNATVATKGHSVLLAADSNKAVVNSYSDGTPASYTFDSKYNGYSVKYHWFNGDMNNDDEWLDQSFYITTELGIGQVPTAPEQIVIENVIDYEKYSVNTHTGWDYDGDGEDAETLSALTLADVTYQTDVYLYPTFAREYMTVIFEDSTGAIPYYSTSATLNSSVWSQFKAGYTMKLLADFEVSGASGFTPSADGGVYNLDFNGHTIFLKNKATYIQVKNGATLNIYSSVPGGMFYGLELTESTSDKRTNVGAGVFVQLKDGFTESLAAAQVSTYATAINIGTVTVGGKTYPGSNLTLAGDCIVEPRIGGSKANINIEGTTLVRSGSDYGAMIFTRYYNGSVNVKDTTFVIASAGKNIFGNHANGDGATCTASFDNCAFLFDVSGADSSLIYRNNGFESITFTNCITNGRFNPATASGVTSVGEGNAAVAMEFRTGDYQSGVVNAKYNVAMQMPNISELSSYYNPDKTSSASAYISKSEDGVLRLQRWAFSSDTSIGAYGGAVTDGYLYIVPNGYEGNIPSDATLVLELPILNNKTTKDTVTVTYNDFAGNEIATETYAKGGVILEAPEVSVAPVDYVVTSKVYDGNCDKALPIVNLTDDVILNPVGAYEAKLGALKASVSLYSDFKVNLYIPVEYSSYIESVSAKGEDLELTSAEEGGVSYVKATVSLASFEAATDAVFTVNVSENGNAASGTVSFNIADYAKVVLDDSASTESDIKLINYMVAYANEAVKYFKGKEDSNLAALVTDVQNYEVGEALDVSALAAAFKGATVDLGASLSCVLRLQDDFVGTVSVIGREFTVSADSEREIVLDGLTLPNFAEDIEIVATDVEGNELVRATYNLSTFVQYHTANAESSTDSSEALELIVAFYNYVCAAGEYVNAKG